MSRFAGQRIAMLGIGGSGMRGLATLLKGEGATVIGIDKNPTSSAVVGEAKAGPEVASADLVIHSDALGADHPLLQEAEKRGIPKMIYHEVVGEISRNKRTLAVTGTHGKSSTTAMLAHIFTVAGFDPTALVGASIPAWNGEHARLGTGDYFIVEADEYRNHFFSLAAESAIITSIDFDHPDFFASKEAVVKSFEEFISRISVPGAVFISENLYAEFPTLSWPKTVQIVGMPTPPFELSLPGTHMQQNAALALALATHYGIEESLVREALSTFTGLRRRFEKLGDVDGMTVISDYGHHPAEIAATLQAARGRFHQKKISVLFEGHTRERLELFTDAFIDALALADGVVLVPPYLPAGRTQLEEYEPTRALKDISNGLIKLGKDVQILSEYSALPQVLPVLAKKYGVTIAFSAGKLDQQLRSCVKR